MAVARLFQTIVASRQPVAAIWPSVMTTDRPWSHLKRCRCPASVAALMAGIKIWRANNAVNATATKDTAGTADAAAANHQNAAPKLAVTITNP